MSGRGHARRLAARLSGRDLAILQSLRELRLMSGDQVWRLHFPGGHPATQARKARAALARLVRLALIVRLRRQVGGVRGGSQGFTFGLSGLGQAVLDLDQPAKRHRRMTETKPAFADHALMVSELRVELAEVARSERLPQLDFLAEPKCWRPFAGAAGQTVVLKPDAFVRLVRDGYELTAFVEVDMATESLPTISRKLAVYVAYWRSGTEQARHGVFPRTWWLVPTPARAAGLTSVIRRLPAEARPLFSVRLHEDATNQLISLPTQGGDA